MDKVDIDKLVPEGGVVEFSITVIGYIDERGEGAYCYDVQGNPQVSHIVGLLEMAKDSILTDARGR